MSPSWQTKNGHCQLILPHGHTVMLDSEFPSFSGDSGMTVSALSTSQVQALLCQALLCADKT